MNENKSRKTRNEISLPIFVASHCQVVDVLSEVEGRQRRVDGVIKCPIVLRAIILKSENVSESL
jgi:hypothetical protein